MTLLFFCADFHSICPCSDYEFVGEDLKFTVVSAHETSVDGESYVAYGPATNADGCMVVMKCSCMIFPRSKLTRWVRGSIPDGHLQLS